MVEMAPTLDHKESEHIINALSSSVPDITLGKFTFTRESSDIRIKHNGEYFVELTESQMTPERLMEIYTLPKKYSNGEEIGEELEWEHIPETKYLREWRTQFDGNSIYIEVGRHIAGKQYTVHAPVEDIQKQRYNSYSSTDDVANEGVSFSSFESAVIYSAWYMEEYHPHEVDRMVRAEKIAKRKFRDIPGVGDTKVEELVDNRHARTYEEALQNKRVISRNYRDDAVALLEELIDNGERIADHKRVQEVSAQILTENI